MAARVPLNATDIPTDGKNCISGGVLLSTDKVFRNAWLVIVKFYHH